MFYVHYWYNPQSHVGGFVDSDKYVGKSPHGGSEQLVGPFSTRSDAEKHLRWLIDSNNN